MKIGVSARYEHPRILASRKLWKWWTNNGLYVVSTRRGEMQSDWRGKTNFNNEQIEEMKIKIQF